VAQHVFAAYPGGLDGARADARANRAFLGRAVRYLVAEAGIRQFLDIGTGIPNADNTHAVAQQTDPACRIVYVDNDPIVLAHAHSLLKGTPEGATAYVDGDFREPKWVLSRAALTLDLSQPVAIVLVGLLHVIPDDGDPQGIVAALLDAVPSGSYLAISHMTSDLEAGDMAVVSDRLDENMHSSNPPALRSRDEVMAFFEGVELVEPGLVRVADWRPDGGAGAGANGRRALVYGGVGRKP
jgi:hypothetical protein